MLAAAATVLVACGGSPAPHGATSSRPDGSHAPTGGSSAPAGPSQSASTSAGHVAPAASPRTVQALSLLTTAHLPAALGTGVHGFEDDGGTATTYPSTGFVSDAETETRLTRFRVSLQSWTSPTAAREAYGELTRSGGTPIPGLGDKAIDQVGEQIVVLHTSQVLIVGVIPTTAGEDYLATHDKSPAALRSVLDRPARAAAKALAPQLTGTAVTGPYLQLPAGAIDPCNLSTAKISAATKAPVTLVNAPSENRPAQQCDVALGGSPFLVQTYTAAQAAAALPATTLSAVYSADLRSPTLRHRLQMSSGHIKAFMAADQDFVLEILATPATAGYRQAIAPETAHEALIRIKNAHTGPLTRAQCYALGQDAALQLVVGHPNAEADAFFHELVTWCQSVPKGP